MLNEFGERRLSQPIADRLVSLVIKPTGTPITFAKHCPGLSNANYPFEAAISTHMCGDHCRFLWCGPLAIAIETRNIEAGDHTGPREIGEGADCTTWIGRLIGTEKDKDVWTAIYGEIWDFPPYRFRMVALVQCDGPPVVRPYAARSRRKGPEWRLWKAYATEAAEAVYRHRVFNGGLLGCKECSA